jgi:hypothetical protein
MNMSKKLDYMDADWVCPYCGSVHIEGYKKLGIDDQCETLGVTCENGCYYLISSDQEIEQGEIMGQITEDRVYDLEDILSAHGDQLCHEMREEASVSF